VEFKYWLSIQESEILLARKRSADSSGFCLHNPKINNFAKSNSTNMFIVFAFVFYTIQKQWPLVTQTFPLFLKWVFEQAVEKDDWDYSKQSFAKFPNLMGANKSYPYQARYLAELWKKKNEIYSGIMSLMKNNDATSEYEIFKYIFTNVGGLGIVKAAFASQLILGKFGCIVRINTAVYKSMINKDIETKGVKSAFTLKPRKSREGKIITDDEGKPVMDPVLKSSILGLKGYIAFLQTLEELYGDNVSKILWDDWCEIVDKKVARSNGGEEISISLNDKEFKIKPYRRMSHFSDLLDKEKENLSSDPESSGIGVSKGHLDAITSSDYRTPKIKALENNITY